MPIYRAPTRDTRFVVNELLRLGDYGNLAGFESADRETTDTVIDEAGRSSPRSSPRSTTRATRRAARATPTAA